MTRFHKVAGLFFAAGLLTALMFFIGTISLADHKGTPHGGGGGGGEDPPPAALPEYSLTPLGTLGGSWSQVYGMNDFGDVVGRSERANGSLGAFIFTQQGGMQDLGLLLDSGIGLNRPKQFLFGPGGLLLYVSNSGSDNVLVYDATNGQLLGDFVSSGSGGLDSPHGLAFHSSGDLLVSSRGTDEVLRYDAISGAFAGVFVSTGSGGLDNPVNITFG